MLPHHALAPFVPVTGGQPTVAPDARHPAAERSTPGERRVGTWAVLPPLLLVAAFALLLRAVWLSLHGAVIENEGAVYARLAENLLAGGDYVGVSNGRNTMFPPLYPMAIAAVSVLTRDAEVAARLLSCASGVILVWPVYGITRYLGDQSSALIAAFLAAGCGLLVALSGSTYSESVYFLLVLSGIYFSCRAFETAALRDAAAAGVLLGCAYLVRPEALAYAALAVLFFVILGLIGRWRQALWQVVTMAVSVTLIAAPYVAWLSLNSGYFRWEGKSLVNGIISDGLGRGMTYAEAARGLGSNLERLGPDLAADQFEIVAPTIAGPGIALDAILASSLTRLVELLRTFATQWSLGGPALTLFALVGLATSLRERTHRAQKLFFAACGASYVVVLLSLQFHWDRFLFPWAVMALPWAAVGIATAGRTFERLTSRTAASASRGRLVFFFTVAAGTALVAIPGPWLGDEPGELSQSTERDLKSAGLWLRDRNPAVVMGYSSVVPYYAGAQQLYLPWAAEDVTLRYVRAVRPEFVYLRSGDEDKAPYIERWLAQGIPDACAVPRQTFAKADGGQLAIYEWLC